MSKLIKLSAQLPGDPETNGLDSLHEELLDNPHQVLVALVWLDVPAITQDVETDEKRVTVRVRKIEPIDRAERTPRQVVELYQELQEKRLGREPLPFESTDPRVEVVHSTSSWDDEDEAGEQ